MERLGLGPGTLIEDNPSLVYARLTGFGQTGPYKVRLSAVDKTLNATIN